MKILFVTAEMAPWSQTGGLGDVARSLSVALSARGHQVRVMTPRYGSVDVSGLEDDATALSLQFPFGSPTARFRRTETEGVEVIFVEEAGLFGERKRIYDEPDDGRRFGFFSIAALGHAEATGFAADVVHLHDWHTGLAALALKRGVPSSARCVFTIHNLAVQGNFPLGLGAELGISSSLLTWEGVEFYGQLSFMKAGLIHADALTTVSPTYAQEVQTPEGGCGFDGVLRSRAHHFVGVLNGIDTHRWDPSNDSHLPAHFSADDLSGKERCTQALLSELELPAHPRGPLFGSVGRLVEQKGVALWQATVAAQLQRGARAVVLGSGEAQWVEGWKRLQRQFPDRLKVVVGFDDALAHRIEAGSDFFVMPSRFEPCGLNQMYSQRYGTVPIVHAIGGLKDTVVDLAQPGATGIRFDRFDAEALSEACHRAWSLWGNPTQLQQVRRQGMVADFSWNRSAAEYEAVYAKGKTA